MGLDLYIVKKTRKNIGEFRQYGFLLDYLDKSNEFSNEITLDVAEHLLNLCNNVLSNPEKAEEFLPSPLGLSFGEDEYNETYYKQVSNLAKYVKDILIPEIKDLKNNEYITYEACW